MNSSEQPTSWMNASVRDSSRGIALVVVESCIFLVLDLTAFVGNALVCVAVYRNTSLRTITNTFILSLALTDLLMAVLIRPFQASASIADEWIGGIVGLEIHRYCGYILASTSLLTMMLVAINRYFRVVRPTLYSKIYSKKSSTVMAVAAWIVSIVTFVVGLHVSGIHFRPYPANPSILLPVFPSSSALSFYISVYGLFFGVTSFVITVCCVRIYQTIRRHNIAAASSLQEGHSSYGVEEAKITKMLAVVVIGFYICWLPPVVVVILNSLKLIDESSRKFRNFYYAFPAFFSNVINPFIYTTMSRPFRIEFLKIMTSWKTFHIRSGNHTTSSAIGN